MKYLFLLLLSFSIISCCGTKKVIESQPEPEKEVTVVSESSDKVESTLPSKEKKMEEAVRKLKVQDSTITIISVDSSRILYKKKKTIGMPPLLAKRIKKDSLNDDLSFHQNVSKGEGYIHNLFNELLKKNVSIDGKVNYKGFRNSQKDLLGYIKVLTMLYPELDQLSKEEKIAYWINAYNALTVDLIIRNYPLKSIKDIKDPWDQRLWKFGNKWLNLNDIEHKILRKMDEPRIHFAIVCASESCPKLQNTAFTAENLDEQLTNATKEFLADTTKNEISEENIKLSKIFRWFKKDFEQGGSLIDFLNRYSDITISEKAKKSYKNYSWDLND